MEIEQLMAHENPDIAVAAEDLRERVKRVEGRRGTPEFRVAQRVSDQGWWAHSDSIRTPPRLPVRCFGLRPERRGEFIEKRGRYMGGDEEYLEFLRAIWAALFETQGVSVADLTDESLERILGYLEDLSEATMCIYRP